MMLRVATKRGIHGKLRDHYLVCLQWIDCEDLVTDFADWVKESSYQGPVFAFDSFERQKSQVLRVPRPDNFPAPEPSGRLRVQRGYADIPTPVSVLFCGPSTPKRVANKIVREAPEGCIVIFDCGALGVARDGIPLLICGSKVAMRLV